MLPAVTAVLYLGAHGQSQPPIEASVFYDGEYTVKVGLDTTAAAWGSFANTLNITGWGVLDIRTSGVYTDVVQHHAAGVLEGALTAAQIYPTYLNNNGFTFHGNNAPPKVVAFMAQQDAWTRAQIKGADPSDGFWSHVAALTAQFDGMVEGCGKRNKKSSTVCTRLPRESEIKGEGGSTCRRGVLVDLRAFEEAALTLLFFFDVDAGVWQVWHDGSKRRCACPPGLCISVAQRRRGSIPNHSSC